MEYDAETKKWLRGKILVQTTMVKCEDCGQFYKPSLGHKCKGKRLQREMVVNSLEEMCDLMCGGPED